MDQWQVQLVDGRVIVVSGVELVRMIRERRAFPNTKVCVQGHPWVELREVQQFAPLFHSPINQITLSPAAIKSNKRQNRILLGVLIGIVIGFPTLIFILAQIQERERAKAGEKAAAIEKAKKEEEARLKAVEQKAFDEMPAAQKFQKAFELQRTNRPEAFRYIGAIPASAPEFKKAQSLKAKIENDLATERKVQQDLEQMAAEHPTQKLQVVKADWSKGGFGSVAMWRVTFRNTGRLPLGNIKYRTIYFSETNKVVDKGGVDSVGDKTVQKVIKPGEKRTIEINDGFLHKEADTARFEIVSCEVIR
jgi:hypothetical protein